MTQPRHEESTSASRYDHRRRRWARRHRLLPGVRHHAWWLLHNCISHPWLGIVPSPRAIWFHDFTSQHLNQFPRQRTSPRPQIENRWSWAWHNIAGHLAIGLLPTEGSFRFHDRTATAMKVPDWV
jgi:hypothetical protein